MSKIQVKYKQELISKIKEVKENCKRFENDWRNAGPTVGTNDPRLVLRRLINFRTTFDTLQNKIDSIQSGQKLFGIDMLRLENFYTIGKTIAILESLLSIWQVLEKTLSKFDNTTWMEFNVSYLNEQVTKLKDVFVNSCFLVILMLGFSLYICLASFAFLNI